MEILIVILCIFVITGLVRSWSNTFKISYYETMLERYEKEAGIKLPDHYEQVKNDFWVFAKKMS